MGNREKLLVAAKKLLTDKGYGAITARDLVAASGTNLASIGYHFGSKEALLTEAILDGFDAWGDHLGRALAEITAEEPIERLRFVLEAIGRVFAEHPELTVASQEALARAPHAPEVRARLAELYRFHRPQLATVVLGREPAEDRQAHQLGSTALALIDGLAVQWLISPADAPSPADVVAALRALLG